MDKVIKRKPKRRTLVVYETSNGVKFDGKDAKKMANHLQDELDYNSLKKNFGDLMRDLLGLPLASEPSDIQVNALRKFTFVNCFDGKIEFDDDIVAYVLSLFNALGEFGWDKVGECLHDADIKEIIRQHHKPNMDAMEE